MSDLNDKTVCKIRLRFSKTDDARFLSHHDLMRLMERLCRRADIALCQTEGFNPKAKITFASALGLGIIGHQEVVEIELEKMACPIDIVTKLNALVPMGLYFRSGRAVPLHKTVQPTCALYFYPLPQEYAPDLSSKLKKLMLQENLIIQRVRTVLQSPKSTEPLAEERLDAQLTAVPVTERKEIKKLDIRPFIRNLWRDDHGYWMDVAITNHGAIRPEELLRMVDLEEHMLDGLSILHRVRLQLDDEPNYESEVSMPAPDDSLEVTVSKENWNITGQALVAEASTSD